MSAELVTYAIISLVSLAVGIPVGRLAVRSGGTAAEASAQGVNVQVGHEEPSPSQRLYTLEVERRLAQQGATLDSLARAMERLGEVEIRQQTLLERIGGQVTSIERDVGDLRAVAQAEASGWRMRSDR